MRALIRLGDHSLDIEGASRIWVMSVSSVRIVVLTSMAMVAFAGNSLLCRAALKHTTLDPASFTAVRVAAGATVLWLLLRFKNGDAPGRGSWWSAAALFAYAAGFSFAYVSLPAATGALLLFGAVQATMIGYGLWSGERLAGTQVTGLLLALGGLVGLLLPGLSAPPMVGSLLMMGAGIAWGVYSLRGKAAGDPTRVTAGNFLRATPMALALLAVMWQRVDFDSAGITYALLSGALASGLGYALWYSALPALSASSAATVQLSVPVIAALGGVIFLGEAITLRMTLASLAILGGIALVITARSASSPAQLPES